MFKYYYQVFAFSVVLCQTTLTYSVITTVEEALRHLADITRKAYQTQQYEKFNILVTLLPLIEQENNYNLQPGKHEAFIQAVEEEDLAGITVCIKDMPLTYQEVQELINKPNFAENFVQLINEKNTSYQQLLKKIQAFGLR